MIKNYFVCANSSRGFINFFSNNLVGLKKVFILKGGPGCGKSTLMKKIGNAYDNMNFVVEFIHCSSDADSLDGIIIRKLGVAIVDGTAPHVIEPTAPGALEEYVHLGTAWNIEQLETNVDKIIEIQGELKTYYSNVYEALRKGLKVHDEWEKYYIAEMDFHKADSIAEDLKYLIIDQTGIKRNDSDGKCLHRFFDALTPESSVDYIENLTEGIKTRYFIKGRPGSGKSSILKKISGYAVNRGLDVEIYHCNFDPYSLDMVIIPSLSVCVFDSTPPHEYYPSREGDIIIDMYADCMTPGTDEKYAVEFEDIVQRYSDCMKEARRNLGMAKCLHDDLEKYYINATDFSKITNIQKDLMNRIQRIYLSQI